MDGIRRDTSFPMRARAHIAAAGKPRADPQPPRWFRRPTETRRRRRRDRGDDGGFKTKIISIVSRPHRFRSSARYRSRDARNARLAIPPHHPTPEVPRFPVQPLVDSLARRSRTYHEATLAHGTRLHRDGVGRAGIGGIEGFNVVLFVRHGKCVEVQSGGRPDASIGVSLRFRSFAFAVSQFRSFAFVFRFEWVSVLTGRDP